MIGLHHVGRTVVNLHAQVRDLRAITDWPISVHSAEDSPFAIGRDVVATALAEGPNGWIELVQVDASEPGTYRDVCCAGLTHAAIQTSEIDEVVTRLDASDVGRHPGPVELGNGFRYLYVRDGEHLVTEVEGAPHAPPELDAWLAHGAIATADLDRLRSSYEHLLGRSATTTVRVRDLPAFDRAAALDDVDVTATWVPTANAPVEMWQYHHPPTGENPRWAYERPGNGHLAFETDDVARSIDRAVAAGFEIIDDPTTADGVEVARVLDPDGNWVELLAFHTADDPRSLGQRPDIGRVADMNALLHEGRS